MEILFKWYLILLVTLDTTAIFILVHRPQMDPYAKGNQPFSPCAYRTHLKTLFRYDGSKKVVVQVNEKICIEEINTKRRRKGIIPPYLQCVHIYHRRKINIDENDQPIKPPINVSYRGSCELRCVSDCRAVKYVYQRMLIQ